MFLEILFLIILVAILICLVFYPAKIQPSQNPQQDQLGSVCLGGNCFQVELAKTETQREKGLMFREELDKNKGMLFIFDKEGIYPFWMKNTLISLDIIWIDTNSKVVLINQNVQPCKSLICPLIIPSAKAKYVLEINAGLCKEIGLVSGDELKINIK